MLEVHCLTVGALEENTYCVVSPNGDALLFDPGAEPDRIIKWIRTHGWRPMAVLLTHCHLDHIGAVDAIRDAFRIEAYVHPIEAAFLENPMLNLSGLWGGAPIVQRPAEQEWQEMGQQNIGDFQFQVAFVPGHSPGHVVYIFHDDAFVIGGDVLFKQGIGRTDLPQGSYQQLMRGIKDEILTLPHSYRVYPGHGALTTIADEVSHNPYLEVFRQK